MRKRSCFNSLLGFVVPFFCVGAAAAQHGPTPELGVALVVAGKQACDRAIPGFAAKTHKSYVNWKSQNSSVIARAEKARYDGGRTFEQLVQHYTQLMLKEPQNELAKACNEVIGWLGSHVE